MQISSLQIQERLLFDFIRDKATLCYQKNQQFHDKKEPKTKIIVKKTADFFHFLLIESTSYYITLNRLEEFQI